ncbi:hypothetical protein GTY81_06900 [Streptomyces sp. SID8366]|uniref:hypothetical protein n=1 Tax=unclassified Streptomyces TaxID=2593676 RepID=UPI000DC32262|nr:MULTISPECIES: hypothetical protein [unclassified Streptomyces]MYU03628.1 hypothetical protein [Streptomyces sp. SID8366]MYU64078.1 hypothetical protein [Streptomyces sp. SID69]RAJ57689.1 hypothetical protein K376_03713 [Streptomyces sp. PsTaAH-130]
MARRKQFRNTRIRTALAVTLLGVAVLLVAVRITSPSPAAVRANSWVIWNSMGTGYNPS